MSAEELTLGASHADKVGRTVIVDVDGKGGRYLVAGVLASTRDDYGEAADLERTLLVVGGQEVVLDWDGDDALTALIEAV